jgi:hypothetical protein
MKVKTMKIKWSTILHIDGRTEAERAASPCRALVSSCGRWAIAPTFTEGVYRLLDKNDLAELTILESVAEESAGYAEDWIHGETLIRDSYFPTYARELADDIGALPDDAAWPHTCIDWEKAARELQMDYTAVDFAGVTYWIR